MIGLAVLGFLFLWLAVAAFITKAVFRRLPQARWRLPLAIGICLLVVPLPLIDEIIGAIQFARLCAVGNEVAVDEAKTRGRVVKLKKIPHPTSPQYLDIPRRTVPYTLVPIREDSWDYVDVKSGEPVVSYKTYEARGGWFVRLLGVSEGSAPLIFRSYCAPRNPKATLMDLGIEKPD